MKKSLIMLSIVLTSVSLSTSYAQEKSVDKVQLLSNDLQITKDQFLSCFKKIYPIQSKAEDIFIIKNADSENRDKLANCLRNYNKTLNVGRVNMAITLRNRNEDNLSH